MAEVGVGQAWDIGRRNELLHCVCLFLPLLSLKHAFRPLLIEFLEDVHLLAFGVDIDLTTSSATFLARLWVHFRCCHHSSLIVGLPKGVEFLLQAFLQVV